MEAFSQVFPNLVTTLVPAEADEHRALADAAAGGNRTAFAELVRRAQSSVFGLCYRLLGDRTEAADAAQEAFVRAYASLSSFDSSQRFDVWVMRIARNYCFDLLRRKGFRPIGEEEAADMADARPSARSALKRRRPRGTWRRLSTRCPRATARSSPSTTCSGARPATSPRCWGSRRGRSWPGCSAPETSCADSFRSRRWRHELP